MKLEEPRNTDLAVPDEKMLQRAVAMLFSCSHDHEFVVVRRAANRRMIIDPAAKQCLADQGIAFTR